MRYGALAVLNRAEELISHKGVCASQGINIVRPTLGVMKLRLVALGKCSINYQRHQYTCITSKYYQLEFYHLYLSELRYIIFVIIKLLLYIYLLVLRTNIHNITSCLSILLSTLSQLISTEGQTCSLHIYIYIYTYIHVSRTAACVVHIPWFNSGLDKLFG